MDKKRLRKLFYTLMIMGGLYFIIITILTHGEWTKSVFHMGNKSGQEFSDFWYSVRIARSRHPYILSDKRGIGFPYPPLGFFLYYLIGVGLPESYFESYNTLAHQVLSASYYMVITTVFLMGVFALITTIMERQRVDKYEIYMFISCMMFSALFIFNYERGNNVLYTFFFLCLYVFYNSSSNKKMQEISYISLAIAAGLKMSPAIFGVFLLKERRWKEAVRCAIYGLILFILPIFFFDGIGDIFRLKYLIREYLEQYGNTFGGWRVDFVYALKILAIQFGVDVLAVEGLLKTFSLTLSVLLFGVAFLSKDRWKSVLALSLIVTAGIEISWTYNAIYLFIPLLYFLYFENNCKKMGWIYILLFSLILVPLPFPVIEFMKNELSNFPITFQCYIEELAILAMAILLIMETLIKCILLYVRSAKRMEIS